MGDLTASVAVTYQSRTTAYTQSTISEAATWDWSKLSETVELTDASNPTKTEEFLLADLDDRITFTEAFGDAKAIVMKDMQFPSRAGFAQGNIIKLKTSVAGTIDVDFSNTGKDRPYRYLYVNGEPTEFKSNEATKLSATGIEVPAGDIELKGYIPDATDPVSRDGDVVGDAMLRWYKITFTPKAGGGEEPASNWKDIKADLTQLQDLATESNVYIKVAEDGSISKTENAEEANATLKGKWHGTSYGWSNFTASVPVEGCVKITYATHDYGNDIVVTNEAGAEVAKFNTKGAKWSSDPANVVVAYYRTNEPTTLHFSNANYNPYFAVEAIAPADLPAEVSKYNINFAAADDVKGVVPAAVEIEAGSKITAPKNYSLYKEGYTLIGWEAGNAVYLPGQEITPEADMTLTAKFGENEVSLADRTAAVTIDYNLSGYNDYPKYKFEGSKGFIVTQATVNGKSIDVKADVDATSGKFAHNGSGWHQVNTGTKVTVPSCKDATFAVATYNSAASVNFNGAAGTEDSNTAIYTATANDATLEISQVSNNYWNALTITLPVTSQGGDEPAAQDITATWDFVHNCANLAPKAEGGAYTATTMASDVESIEMTIVYNGGQIKNNDNSYYVGTGVEMQIPVKNVGDEVTVVGYPGYFHYSIAGVEAENQTTTYKAKATDVSQGYVAVVATASNNYINSISVTQYAPKAENIVEKSIYKTDFSDWELASPSDPATTVTKTTKYTKQDLVFTLFQTSVMATEDSKFASYTTLPRMTLRAEKDKGSYFITSALAEITKIRFIHGATGSNRGWKVEAKGEGDNDWVVVSSDPANPQNWCEVTKSINKKNCQLRFTNLADNQNAFLFNLEIFGNVDLAGEPLLGSFKANGKEYVADDVFEMNNTGSYEGTIEVSKSATIIGENNPLTDIVADNGEIGNVTYATSGEGANQKTVVTIPVTAEKGSVNYILNVVFKPDFTLTYYDVTGEVFGTQTVEKDTKIGKFEKDVADVKATKEGYKARGWFKNNYVGEKYSTEDVITGDTPLYAVETEIEGPSDSRKYEFDLRSKTFYAEDHEAFNVVGKGKWHDGTHGWSFYNGDKIELLVGKKATISVSLCQYGSGTNILVKNAAGETLETLAAKSETDGSLASFNYEGEEGTLTLEMVASGEMYIHSVKIFNTSETNYDQKGQWIYVKQGDASSFLDAIDAANGMSGTDRIYVYVPNGTYDLGQTTLTTIGRNNISIIGESMEGTIIKNRPIKEGIAITATLLNTASNTYLQDLTLDCIAPYGTGDDTKSAERGVCLQDKGTKTVCKNVYLKGLQDTYYSNGAEGMTAYFENCKIEGTVDFICGNGSVLFNECDLYVADRTQSKTSANVITAPATYASEKGYAFYGCTIDGTDNQKDEYNLGRPWQKSPAATYVNTTMKINASSAGWTSMNKADAIRFHEFNTKNAEGSEVKTHNVNACETSGTKDELYLTEEQAANYAPDKFFTSWTPETVAKQVDAPTDAKLENGTITWTAVPGAAGYAIFANDELLAIVDADVTSYVIENAGASRRAGSDAPVYTIRAVNAMGGFGEAKIISDATGISEIKAEEKIDWDNQVIYDLNGRRVKKASKGVFIINGNKVIIK